MINFAEATFELNKTDDKGLRLWDQNEIMESAGHIDSSWRPKPPSHQMFYLWSWFCELDATRGRTFDGGPMPITFVELEAWARLTGRKPTPFEVEQVRALDNLYFKVRAAPKVEHDDTVQSSDQIASMFRSMAKADKGSAPGFL